MYVRGAVLLNLLADKLARQFVYSLTSAWSTPNRKTSQIKVKESTKNTPQTRNKHTNKTKTRSLR